MKTIRTRDNDRNACAELTPRGIVRGEGGGAVPNSIFKLCCFTQANNDIHTLGESKTGICSYDAWLYQVLDLPRAPDNNHTGFAGLSF